MAAPRAIRPGRCYARGRGSGGAVSKPRVNAAQRARDAAVAALVHDLRSPLASILARAEAVAEWLRDAGPAAAAVAAQAERIAATVELMAALLNEALDVAALAGGRPLALLRAPTDLAALTRRVAAECGRAPGAHRISLVGAGASNVGAWDERRLERVLRNLLSNALKY